MIPARQFYLIRHGETEANAAHITAGGDFDTPLTDKGIAQAQEVASVIHHLDTRPTRIIHSSMSRARDTATIINGSLGLPMDEEHDIREHLVGEWEGLPWDEVAPQLTANIRPKGGENKDDFSLRIRTTFTRIFETPAYEQDTIMFVAHGGVFHALMNNYRWFFKGHIQNCHLHLFTPQEQQTAFPWQVCRFDVNGESLVRDVAAFCPRSVDLSETTAEAS